MQQPLAHVCQKFFSLVVLAFVTGSAIAGGGPENIFLIVNSADSNSLTVANHFTEWRKVPTSCVFEIDWPDAPLKTDIDTFRGRILGPILKEIKRRQLTKQIDYIIYSSGFPYAVDFSSDLGTAKAKFAEGSLTSLTYLYELVMKKDKSYQGAVNAYARNLMPNLTSTSQGFRSHYGIDPTGKRAASDDGSPHYYLSMMLASMRGPENNTLPEVLRYLQMGVQADGKRPKGSIYYVRNDDVRSKVRHNQFAGVVSQLKELGVNAEEIEGARDSKTCLPVGKKDVMGAMTGFYKFHWRHTGSRILPGAICENFTSYGGVLDGTHIVKQTLLCEFLRYGAVASSGTVAEPYATAAKFPHAKIHLHYARGCSVAEAYYQSVLAPYQLIIVGDPLCQPWAVAPEVSIAGLDTKSAISGTQELTLTAKSRSGAKIRNCDIFVDGLLLLRALPDSPFKLDTTKLANGYHELRVVAVEETNIETQGRYLTAFVSMNGTQDPANGKPNGVTGKLVPPGKLRPGAVGYAQVQSRGAKEIRLYKGRRLIGNVLGESGQIRFTASELGGGTSVLTLVAVPKAGGTKAIFGFPLTVKVQLGG